MPMNMTYSHHILCASKTTWHRRMSALLAECIWNKLNAMYGSVMLIQSLCVARLSPQYSGKHFGGRAFVGEEIGHGSFYSSGLIQRCDHK